MKDAVIGPQFVPNGHTHGHGYLSFLLLSIVSLLAVYCQHAYAGLNSGPEYTELQALYNSTHGANWTTHTGWGSGDACSWYGITCNQDLTPTDNTSHVTQISLSTNNLTGSIPALTGLIQLQYLALNVNHLTGSIPALTGLTNLQALTLGDNQLTGSIPALTGLTNLYYFYVGNNQLTGSIPALTGLTSLQYLVVNNNQLTGSIPALTGLTKLSYFSVYANKLTGPIPALTGLTSLDGFYVDNNQLTGTVPTAPPSLLAATLCPNSLDTTPQASVDPAWNTATLFTPWWATPFASNQCDDLFTSGFGG